MRVFLIRQGSAGMIISLLLRMTLREVAGIVGFYGRDTRNTRRWRVFIILPVWSHIW